MAEMAIAAEVGHHNERLETAYEEGHDADYPPVTSMAGQTKTPSSLSESDVDHDIEKSGRPTSLHSSDNGVPNFQTKEVAQVTTTADDNIVDWDGPDDPANPMNWTEKKKWGNITCLSILTLLTPLGSSMFAPGVPELMAEFHTTSSILGSLVVSIYILGYCIGPLIVSPLSEIYGRWILYQTANVLYIIFTIACAVSTNMGMLCAFRFLAGMAGITPITIGAGTIADMVPQEKRGTAMALWALGPLLGPIIGPVAGGYLAASAGWRWIFWVIAIATGVVAIANVTLSRETFAPVLLARKTAKLIKETGNTNLRSKLDSGLPSKTRFARAIVRPTKMLFLSPIVFLMSLYMALAYGTLYLLFTTFTFVFTENYGFSDSNVGLTYIALGIGCMVGLAIVGFASDRILKRLAAKNGGVMRPEYRLPPVIFFGIFIPIGLFIYGWTAQYKIQWAVPLFGTMLVGVGLIAAFMSVQTYMVDAFTVHAASAIAANTVLRSLFGAFLPLCGLQMYAALGLGWGNSLLGFVSLALCAVPPYFYFYGERLRTRFQVSL